MRAFRRIGCSIVWGSAALSVIGFVLLLIAPGDTIAAPDAYSPVPNDKDNFFFAIAWSVIFVLGLLGFAASMVEGLAEARRGDAPPPTPRSCLGDLIRLPFYLLFWLTVSLLLALGVTGIPQFFNGALDSGPAKGRPYVVAQYSRDQGYCGGPAIAGDNSHNDSFYSLVPATAADKRNKTQSAGVIEIETDDCDGERGLPVEDGRFVPVGGEVIVDVKPGLLGVPWIAGYRAVPA